MIVVEIAQARRAEAGREDEMKRLRYITVDQNGRSNIQAVNRKYAPLGPYGSRLKPGDQVTVPATDEDGHIICRLEYRRVVRVLDTIHTSDRPSGSNYVYVEID